MVSQLASTVPLFLLLVNSVLADQTASAGVTQEWKYKMMHRILDNVVKPATMNLQEQVKTLKVEACASAQDAKTTGINDYLTGLHTDYVAMHTARENLNEVFRKQTENVTNYVYPKILEILSVAERLKGDPPQCLVFPDEEKTYQSLRAFFGHLKYALEIYGKIAASVTEETDYRAVIAEEYSKFLLELKVSLEEVAGEGTSCTVGNHVLLHGSHIRPSMKAFTDTTNEMLKILDFLSEELEYTEDPFPTTLSTIKSSQGAIAAKLELFEDLCAASPSQEWPVLKFGELEVYKLILEAIQMNQPAKYSQRDANEDEINDLASRLRTLVYDIHGFNMKLPSTRVSVTRQREEFRRNAMRSQYDCYGGFVDDC